MASGLLALVIAGSGTPIWLAGLYAVAIGALLGMATELFCFRPLGYKQHIAAAVSTIGLAIVIQNATLQLRGSSTAVAVGFPLPRLDFHLGSLLISSVQLVSLGVAMVLMAATHYFVERTRWGIAMRGISHDPDMVALLGVPVRRLALIVAMIAGCLAATAAFLLAVRNGSASPLAGLEVGLKGLAIISIGGLGSLPGAMAAGIGLGLIESYASYFGLTGYQAAVPWVLLILVLLVRPEGLVRRKAL
jgi:branched-chain amino acid transport system permease protein